MGATFTFLLVTATYISAFAAEPADRVLTNGNIETMEKAQPKAEATARPHSQHSISKL